MNQLENSEKTFQGQLCKQLFLLSEQHLEIQIFCFDRHRGSQQEFTFQIRESVSVRRSDK